MWDGLRPHHDGVVGDLEWPVENERTNEYQKEETSLCRVLCSTGN